MKTKLSLGQVAELTAFVKVALARRTRVVKYLQPYFKQGNRWFKLKRVK